MLLVFSPVTMTIRALCNRVACPRCMHSWKMTYENFRIKSCVYVCLFHLFPVHLCLFLLLHCFVFQFTPSVLSFCFLLFYFLQRSFPFLLTLGTPILRILPRLGRYISRGSITAMSENQSINVLTKHEARARGKLMKSKTVVLTRFLLCFSFVAAYSAGWNVEKHIGGHGLGWIPYS